MTHFEAGALVISICIAYLVLFYFAEKHHRKWIESQPALGAIRVAVLDNGKFRVERYELDGYSDEYGDGVYWKLQGTFKNEEDAKAFAESIKHGDEFAKVTGFIPINEANGTR